MLHQTLVVTLLCFIFDLSVGYMVDDNPYRHFVELDTEKSYRLEWTVIWHQRRVIFNITAKTTGYVVFGLAKQSNGKMAGADVFVGGVYSNGRSYFSDRHIAANGLPEMDPRQDWSLHSAGEKDGYTTLSVYRPFDTCDERHDLPITDDAITIMWAFGKTDDQSEYMFEKEGYYRTYLLDPDFTPPPPFTETGSASRTVSTGESQIFQIKSNLTLPANRTVYWCTMHKVPTETKHQIIGFNVEFSKPKDPHHVQKILLQRCQLPEEDEQGESYETSEMYNGSECYFVDDTGIDRFCRETIAVFGTGGTDTFLPEHVGIPMSESGEEYFLMQVHYDNPELSENLTLSTHVNIHYTRNLRRNDAGVLQLGVQINSPTSIVIPPGSKDYVIMGHCAPGCTERIIETREVNIFGALLSTRSAGRAVRLMHHRGDQELSWISNDDNYSSKFTQFRVLKQERRLLPGDHIMERCVYDTTNRNGSVVTGGVSSTHELCVGYLFYYPRSKGSSGICKSDLRTESYKNLLGIRNTTWDEEMLETVVTSPPQFAGLTVAEYANEYIQWDPETRQRLQSYHQFHPQVSRCPKHPFIDSSTIEVNGTGTENYQRTRQGIVLNQNGRFPLVYGRSMAYKDEGNQLVAEYVSVNPRGIPRYRTPTRCSTGYRANLWKPKSRYAR